MSRASAISRPLALRTEGEFGPVDILVANAGGSFTPPDPLEDASEEGWRASVEGNPHGDISDHSDH